MRYRSASEIKRTLNNFNLKRTAIAALSTNALGQVWLQLKRGFFLST